MSSNLIKYCVITLSGKDDGQFPVQQVSYQGKPVDAFIAMPYGMHANIPVDFLGLLSHPSGHEEDGVVFPLSPKEREKETPVGDFIVFNPVTGDKIHFKDGSIDIVTSGDVNITAAGNVNITAPQTTILGDLEITGTITNNTKDIGGNHTHSQPNDSDGDAEAETNGVT